MERNDGGNFINYFLVCNIYEYADHLLLVVIFVISYIINTLSEFYILLFLFFASDIKIAYTIFIKFSHGMLQNADSR